MIMFGIILKWSNCEVRQGISCNMNEMYLYYGNLTVNATYSSQVALKQKIKIKDVLDFI